MRGLVAAGLVLLVVASGCVGGVGENLGTCDPLVDVSLFHPEVTGGWVLHRGEETSIPMMVWIENDAPGPVTVDIRLRGADATPVTSGNSSATGAEVEGLEIEEDGEAFEAFSFDQPSQGRRLSVIVNSQADRFDAGRQDPLCDNERVQHEDFMADIQPGGETVEAGKGVLVRTVGWWPNGSSFYTNMDRYHERPDLPHDYLGPYNGSEPLKVYVYDESSDEMPQRYNESGYVTTIPGFNEALKGMETVGGHVAYLEPEQAYTTEGNEDHPLYGDPLVFYIEALETRTVPCEVAEPVCTPPEPPGVLPLGP